MTALLSLTGLLLVAAFVCTIAAANNPPRLHLWVAVLLLTLANLLSLVVGTVR